MANKRLSELNELMAVEIQPDDLTLTTDISAIESKKLRLQSLKNWVLNDPGSITASIAWNSDTASYLKYSGIPNGTASFSISSSYVLSSSWAPGMGAGNWANSSLSSSFASSSLTASYILYYNRDNGRIHTASYALTASYVENARTSSYIWYTGVPNGTASYAINCYSAAFASVLNVETASYLLYDPLRGNGTASYSMFSQNGTSSYLRYNGTFNGSASYAISSSRTFLSNNSLSSSFLVYTPGFMNGTSSYSMNSLHADLADVTYFSRLSESSSWSSASLSSSYVLTSSYVQGTSSYAISSSYTTGTSSYSIISGVSIDPNQYRIWGPYNSNDSGGSTGTTEAFIQNFIISPPSVAGSTIILMALLDIKTSITTIDTDAATVSLYLDYTEPGNTHSYGPLDTSRPNNYINLSMSGSFSLSGYNRTSVTLGHDWPGVSGSWWKLRVASSGCLINTTRGVTFFLYTKGDTSVTKTAYPPF